MGRTKSGKSNEEASQESRRALIRAGAELLQEEAHRNPFAGLRVRKICERAGYSSGAFYLHWSDADEYQRDLGRFLLADDAQNFEPDLAALQACAEATELDQLAALAELADED